VEFEEPSGHAETLPEISLFSELAPDAFVTVLEKMKMLHVKQGDWIVKEGAQGNSMFAIASGAVRVLKRLDGTKMLQLAILGEGAFFGEMSVIRGGPRGASVQAIKSSDLFEISKELLDEVIGQYPSVGKVLDKFCTQRLLRNIMVTSALFRPFSGEERVRIIERFVSRNVDNGDELITEGVESSGLFVLLRGTLEVSTKVEDGSDMVAGELTEGEVFGEISCLRKEPAMATVIAITPGAVLRLPRKDFDEVVLSHPQILELVNRLGEQRIALTMNALAKVGVLI
ncbi:MAG: cyclic nucleotide-binding domain-containing protein, partial [Deltaproteobacteria bacterium]|nr:cyclic nucleotide-binding domain-containing protein [Deltaproteobacteria bacterium]